MEDGSLNKGRWVGSVGCGKRRSGVLILKKSPCSYSVYSCDHPETVFILSSLYAAPSKQNTTAATYMTQ
jgi:hypothetical protein